MRHQGLTLLGAVILFSSAGCTIGLGTRSPGIVDYSLWDHDVTEWFDSEGRSTTDASEASSYRTTSYYREGDRLSWGLSGGFRQGLSQISVEGLERESPGYYWSANAHFRLCSSDELCFGLDGGYFGHSSFFKADAKDPNRPGTTVQRDMDLNAKGWHVWPVVQYQVFEPVWIEGGVGLDRVSFKRKLGPIPGYGGGGDDESQPAWGLHWLVGVGVALDSWIGLRFGYSRVYAEGVVGTDTLDTESGAWTLELVL